MVGPNLRVRALSLAATAALAVSACGGAGTPVPSTSSESGAPPASVPAGSQAAQPTKGGTAFLLMTTATSNGANGFTDLDPERIYIGEDEAFFDATIQLNLTGYKYSADRATSLTIIGDAATDTGTPSADAKTWSFTLKPNLKWQDGSPVKCEDFAYGASRAFSDVIVNGPQYILTYLDIPTNADGSSKYPGPYKATPAQQALFDNAVSCKGNTITYKLGQAHPDFNFTVTLGLGAVPNPKDHPGVDDGEKYTTHPWSDGPYMIDSYTPQAGGSLKLKRNPNWTDDGYRGAYPDNWEVDFGLDPQVVDGRLMSPTGDDVRALQYGAVQPQNLATIFSDAHTAATAYTGRAFSDYDPYALWYWINIDKVPNVKIRQAMAVAVDRASIKKVYGGDFYGDLGDGLIKPNIGPDYAPTGWATDLFGQAIPPNGNPDLAKQLIAQSGIAAPTLTYDYSKSATADQAAAIIQNSLGKAGFTVKLNAIQSHYYAVTADPAKQHDFGRYGWGPDWPNASTVIPPMFTGATATNDGSDYSRVTEANQPAFEAAITDALTTTDRTAQQGKWQALNKQAVQQAFVIPTFFGLTQTIAGTQVTTPIGLYKWAPFGSWPYGQIYVTQ